MKKLLRNKRGIGSVVGAVILVGIIMTLYLAIFAYEFSYLDLTKQQQNLRRERLSEEFSVVVNNGTLIQVSNTGAITVHIVALYKNHVLINNPDIYIDGSSGAQINLTQSLNIGDVITVASARGNTAMATYSIASTPPPVQAFGVFSLDWFYFKYTSAQQTNASDNRVLPKSNTYVAFYVNVTNNWNEMITIKNSSMIELVVSGPEVCFYVVKNVSYSGTPSITAYNEITVNPGQSILLKCAASAAGVTTWEWGSYSPVSGGTEGSFVMIALMFTMPSKPGVIYGQTLPFQALILSGA